jgi:uncharacterized protein
VREPSGTLRKGPGDRIYVRETVSAATDRLLLTSRAGLSARGERLYVANEAKHGINFEEAQALWDDVDLMEIPARVSGEPRYIIVGAIAGKHWTAIITYRNEHVRIISVRRSRDEEIALYESTGI